MTEKNKDVHSVSPQVVKEFFKNIGLYKGDTDYTKNRIKIKRIYYNVDYFTGSQRSTKPTTSETMKIKYRTRQ